MNNARLAAFGVAEIGLDLETQAVKFDDFFIRQVQVCAEQNDMSLGGSLRIGFQDDDHVQSKSELFVEKLTLVDVGSQPILEGCLFQIFTIQGVNIDFCAILGFWSSFLVFTCKWQVQGCIRAHFGNQV